MMKISIIFIVLILSNIEMYCQSTNDTLFVWSFKGLNFREKPSEKSTKLKLLKPGEYVKYLSHTDKIFKEVIIDPNEFAKHPFLLKSYWIKVISSNDTGYILDSYALSINPNICHSSFDSLILLRNNKNIKIDTIFNQVGGLVSGWDFNVILSDSTQVINHTETGGYTQTYIIQNMTINEAIILIKFYNDKYFYVNKDVIQFAFNFGLVKNWKNELIFQISETCRISLNQIGKCLKIEKSCAC